MLETPEIQTFVVTAYTPTGRRTTSGTWPQTHRTIAADWAILKPGTIVQIESLKGFYVVEDTGDAIKGHTIDLFVNTYSEAIEWGRQKLKVKVLREPS